MERGHTPVNAANATPASNLPQKHWEELTPEDAPVPQPNNPLRIVNPSGNEQNERHDFKDKFVIEPFMMKSKAHRRLGRSNTIVKEGNEPKEHLVPRIVGRAKLDWLNEHKLNENSHPLEWINATLLTKDKNLNGKRKSLFETWAT